MAVCVLRRILANFRDGLPPLTAEEIAEQLGLPHGLVVEEIAHLIEARMVSAVEDPRREDTAYQPARDIHGLRLAQVLEAWDKVGRNSLPDAAEQPLREVDHAVEALETAARKSPSNCLIKDI